MAPRRRIPCTRDTTKRNARANSFYDSTPLRIWRRSCAEIYKIKLHVPKASSRVVTLLEHPNLRPGSAPPVNQAALLAAEFRS